jgi:hypothetical protein
MSEGYYDIIGYAAAVIVLLLIFILVGTICCCMMCICKCLRDKSANKTHYIPNSYRHVVVQAESNNLIFASNNYNYMIQRRFEDWEQYLDVYWVIKCKASTTNTYIVPLMRFKYVQDTRIGKTFGCIVLDNTRLFNLIDSTFYTLKPIHLLQKRKIIGASNRYCIVQVQQFEKYSQMEWDTPNHVSHRIYSTQRRVYTVIQLPCFRGNIHFIEENMFIVWRSLAIMHVYQIDDTSLAIKSVFHVPCTSDAQTQELLEKFTNHHVPLAQRIVEKHNEPICTQYKANMDSPFINNNNIVPHHYTDVIIKN